MADGDEVRLVGMGIVGNVGELAVVELDGIGLVWKRNG